MDSVPTLRSANEGTEAQAGCIGSSWVHNHRKVAGRSLQSRPAGSQSQGFLSPFLSRGLPSHSFLTSSGSESLNSQPSPVQLMKDWQDLSVSNSRRNCHSWIGPLPGSTRHGGSLTTRIQGSQRPVPLCSSPTSLLSACLDRRKLSEGRLSTNTGASTLSSEKVKIFLPEETRKVTRHTLSLACSLLISGSPLLIAMQTVEKNTVCLWRCSKEIFSLLLVYLF